MSKPSLKSSTHPKASQLFCTVCERQARGFGWFDRHTHRGSNERDKSHRKFCSMDCQHWWAAWKNTGTNRMIDPTKNEIKAMEATLKSLGEYIAGIDINRSLASYSKQEALALIDVVITAYQDNLKDQFKASVEVPF